MIQRQSFEEMDPDAVPETVGRLKEEGYRMVQICAVPVEGGNDLVYSFDKDMELLNLKVYVPFDRGMESITPIYWAAFVYENEIHDLFGVEFMGSQLDYGGNFFRISKKTPWKGLEAKGVE